MDREFAIKQYEDNLLYGRRYSFPGTKADKQKDALEIVRYVVSEVMEWSPQTAMKSFDWNVVKELKLDEIIEKYITCPTDIDIHEDPDYVIALAYPGQVTYDVEQKVINVYKKILRGGRPRFPKNYFIGDNGAYKAAVLLMYVLSRQLRDEAADIPSLYKMFANTSYINPLLKKWKIGDVFKNLYNSPLDFLHFSLPEDEADEFLYSNYLYDNIRAEYIK